MHGSLSGIYHTGAVSGAGEESTGFFKRQLSGDIKGTGTENAGGFGKSWIWGGCPLPGFVQ